MPKRKIPFEIMFLLGLKQIQEIFVGAVIFSAGLQDAMNPKITNVTASILAWNYIFMNLTPEFEESRNLNKIQTLIFVHLEFLVNNRYL